MRPPEEADPCLQGEMAAQTIFSAAVFQRWCTSLLTEYTSRRTHRLLSCFATLFFHKPLKTFRILPALKHHYLKITSEVVQTSGTKSFKIIFSALDYKAASKAKHQFTTRPFSYYPINRKRLYCQQLHILDWHVACLTGFQKLKSLSQPERKKKTKTSIMNTFLSHLLPSLFSLQSNTGSETPLFHKQLQNWKESHTLGKEKNNMEAHAHPTPIPEHLWVIWHFTQFGILGLLKKHLAVQYADPFLT